MDQDIEYTYVEKFYNTYAKSFSETRRKPWPKLENFINTHVEIGSTVLDIGCGNGRNIKFLKNVIFLGCDRSQELLKLGPGAVRCDAANLPFHDNSFDYVFSIATIHHLSTHERRLKALMEMNRVMKKKGIIYVWYAENIKQKLKNIEIDDLVSKNKYGDFIVSWNNEFSRYVHFFEMKELENIIKEAGFVIEEMGLDNKSIYAIVSKNL